MSSLQKNLRQPTRRAKKGVRIAVIVSEYNRNITRELEARCLKTLQKAGVAKITVAHVPGAFELPYACQRAIQTQKPHAVIALGCIIKGETLHFELIAQATANGIMEVGLRHNLPVIFGVLTPYTLAQAKARLNKGTEAAETALALI